MEPRVMPVFNWPETIFARRNTPDEQLDHVISEVDEASVLTPLSGAEAEEALHEELADLVHSLETYWRIVGRVRGLDYVRAVFSRVEDKNRARGYYEEVER